MKTTPSGTIRAIALIGVSVAIVITLQTRAQTSPTASRADDIKDFVLEIKGNAREYHELRDGTLPGEAAFILLVCDDQHHHFLGNKHLNFKSKRDTTDPINPTFDLPKDCTKARSNVSPTGQLNIKTDKVTVSRTAQSVPAGDPHVTTQIASTTADDIKAVLDKLTTEP